MDPLADPGARDIHSPTSEFILNLGVWGDATRRHQSIEAKGSRATKTGADYQASTAISRVPAYANFFAEIKIVKCMRGTSIGLVVPTIDLDQQWYVSRLMRKERDVRQRELDKALHAQIVEQGQGRLAANRGEEGAANACQSPHTATRAGSPPRIASPLTREESLAKSDLRKKQLQAEFDARQRKQDLRRHVWQVNQLLNEVDDSIRSLERKVQDRWGPRMWFLTCDGLFGTGAECKDTGVKFTDGDTVRLDMENYRLIFSVNGKEIAETACTVETRTFLAVCLQNKGASLEVVNSSLSELEDIKTGAVLEDITGPEAEVMQISSPILAVAPDSPHAADAGAGKAPDAENGAADTFSSLQGRQASFTSQSPKTRAPRRHGSLIRSLTADSGSGYDHEAFDAVFLKISQKMDNVNGWAVLQKSLALYDPDGTGTIDRQNFLELMGQLHLTEQIIGKSAEV